MPVINSIAAKAEDMKTWRRHLHQHPELGFDCHETAAFVVDQLRSFGITDIHEGIAETGVVALIEGRAPGPTIGLRADMDALAMPDESGTPHASKVEGRAHACGHDGHTSMLLGAAQYLAETRNFSGRVALIFQPAEEGGGGGEVMVKDGMMDRFEIAQVYALHTCPGEEVGKFLTTPGPVMAAADTFALEVMGVGGHAAWPQSTKDPIPPAIAFVQACDTIVSRNRPAMEPMIVTVAEIHAGTASNIIPGTARVTGTVRTYSAETRDMAERRLQQICDGLATSFGVEMNLTYEKGYPATVNHAAETAFAVGVAEDLVGADLVDGACTPAPFGEDFSFMLEARPGCYLSLGQGDTPMCHHPAFDFNDEILPIGASFFARLVEKAQPLP